MRKTKKKDSCPDCGQPKLTTSRRCRSCQHKLCGPQHNGWRGGRHTTEEGYVRVLVPASIDSVSIRGRYVYEHLLVMEGILGRHLYSDERVHHKNTIRSDNSPDNLELWTIGHPAGGRTEDVLIWAQEIVRRYGE